ncbi:hypothetical protein E3E31_08530 [Thermococcus sp. M39]|uniref:hypothetical protein n=1 Tax=Thermococcus sp. M39 TaxID=1638262 RepID=UPI001439F3FB|nr:hypothetical protein [Thermococcus sp. M39]NJE08565.1 hypothetical protein [Thermococcus sp. M39]
MGTVLKFEDLVENMGAEARERRVFVAFMPDWYGLTSTVLLTVEGSPSTAQMLLILDPTQTKTEDKHLLVKVRRFTVLWYGRVLTPKYYSDLYVDITDFLKERKNVVFINKPNFPEVK